MSIVGVHTAETEGERVAASIRRSAREQGLTFPIIVDGDQKNWQAWSNSIWPAVYLIDKHGRVRYWWYGELKWNGNDGERYLRGRIDELIREK